MSKQREPQTVTVATRITKPMLKGLQSVLAVNAHINIADYLSDLIRRDLEGRGVKIDREAENDADGN